MKADKLWERLTDRKRLFLIAGPCVIENEKTCFEVAATLQAICRKLGIFYIFKASYDKANRTSKESFRGIGLANGIDILRRVRRNIGVPVLTDVHDCWQAKHVSDAVDIVQVPALLCRQTDIVQAAAQHAKILNLKKGQFLAPMDMKHVVEKAKEWTERIILTERGTCFGYHNIIADMRAVPLLREIGFPVVFDGTHTVQLPGGLPYASAGDSRFTPCLTKAAVAAGADGVFIECHPEPDKALSDGTVMTRLTDMERLLGSLVAIHKHRNK